MLWSYPGLYEERLLKLNIRKFNHLDIVQHEMEKHFMSQKFLQCLLSQNQGLWQTTLLSDTYKCMTPVLHWTKHLTRWEIYIRDFSEPAREGGWTLVYVYSFKSPWGFKHAERMWSIKPFES